MDVKKKLLFTNDLIQGGGVEKLMQDLVSHLNDKYEITVLTWSKCENADTVFPDNVRYLSANAPTVFSNGFVGRQLNRMTLKLYRKLFWLKFRKETFDIVVAMKEGYNMMETINMLNKSRFGKNVKKYVWVHTDYNNYYYTFDMYGGRQAEHDCYQSFDQVICVAEDIKKSLIDQLGDTGNLSVLYNPIDVENILEKATEAVVDQNPEKEPDVTRFVTVGRLNYQKGFDLLLEACHMLEEDGLKYELWIIGGEEPWSDEHNRLYRKHKKLGLKNVKFLGGRKNPYKYMKCADWFLSSSIFEGYSLVSQEAAVLDIPLILTDCSGVRELLGDSEYGIVMDISVSDIYRKMKMVIEHPELRDHYQKKIMERKHDINFDERFHKILNLF